MISDFSRSLNSTGGLWLARWPLSVLFARVGLSELDVGQVLLGYRFAQGKALNCRNCNPICLVHSLSHLLVMLVRC